MFANFKARIVAGLLACACLFAACGFVAQNGFSVVNAETVGNDNPSVTQGATAPFTQGSLDGGAEGQGGCEEIAALSLAMTNNGASGVDGEGGADGASIEIVSKNVSYSESLYIMYAVKTNVETPVQMLFWDELPEAYEKGTEDYVRNIVRSETVKGEECQIFYSKGIPAKEMNDIVYCRAYAEVDGVAVYGDVLKYSVVDYVYEMRLKDDLTDKQVKMFGDMLDYGASAQDLLEYRTDALANAEYFTITAKFGMLPDGFNKGRYFAGDRVMLTAELTYGDATFSHWEDENGMLIGEYTSMKVTVSGNMTYTAVYYDDLVYELSANGDYYTVTGYRGNGGALNIPSTYMGLPVRYIADGAFRDNASITSVTVPESIVGIGSYSFSGCSEMTSISLPASLTSIGDYALYVCEKLESISVASGNTVYESVNGHLYFKGAQYLLQYAIGNTATEFTVPETVTSIAGAAFRGAVNLTKVVIGSRVSYIGGSAFKSCDNLTIYCETEIQPSEWNTTWNSSNCPVVWGYGATTPASAFTYTNDGSAVTITGYVGEDTDIVIPSTIDGLPVTAIGDNAFAQNNKINSVIIPDSVTYLGSWAFDRCQNLKEATIGNGVTVLNVCTFQYNYDLTTVNFGENIKVIDSTNFFLCIQLTNVVLPNGLEYIGSHAFQYCSAITEIVIPASVTFIDMEAFLYAGLTNVVFENASGWVYLEKNTEISNFEFTTGAAIDFSVLSDGSTAASGLTSTYTENVLHSYGRALSFSQNDSGYSVSGTRAYFDSIEYPYNTSGIILPSSYNGLPVTAISESAFVDYPNDIEKIVIPDSVTSIGEYAFCSCWNLTSVVIPDGVTTIGEYVFSDCSNLTIYCEVEAQPSGWDSNWNYSNCPVEWGYGKVKVQSSEGLAYALNDDGESYSVTGIGACTDIDLIIPDIYDGLPVTKIGYAAFSNYSSLTSVVIPDSVTAIGDSAFQVCCGLTSVVIGESVESIGNLAFQNCDGLTSIVIPDSVTSIGYWAFYGCRGLTSVVIGKNVTSIDSSAFERCSNLTSIVIPNSVTSIGMCAFYYCDNLTIYCEAESQPDGWNAKWNYSNCPVEWGYKGE